MNRSALIIGSLLVVALLAACDAGRSNSAVSPPTSAPPAATAALEPTNLPTVAPTEAPTPTALPTEAPTPTALPTEVPAPTALPTEAPAPTAAAAGAATPQISMTLVTTDVRQPVFLTHAGDGSGRLFVVEKRGTIQVLRDGTIAAQPFLDIVQLVNSAASERGLLGLAFHPDYERNGRFFVYYTAQNGDNTLARYQVSRDPERADAASGVVLLAVPDPAPNHNGGMLAFGPDGRLYVGLGDGGAGGDPWGNGQNRQALLGKLLRLDVDSAEPYAIPPDNPWPSSPEARGEIWAYGLRNPWRFSFDRANGDLYVADVGQNRYEEVDLQRAGSGGGQNYGWNVVEGPQCFRGQPCDLDQFVAPIAWYSRQGGCSITGGYVYRGAAIPALQGFYLFGDYCSGQIWTLRERAPDDWQMDEVLQTNLSISSFGEDEVGELYVVDLSGGIYQIVTSLRSRP